MKRFSQITRLVVASSFVTLASAAHATLVTNSLTFWVDASDLDGDGVAEGLAESGLSGSLVTSWVNKSVINGAPSANQATTSLQPVLLPNTLRGLPVVRFDGVDDFLQTSSFTAVLHQPTEMFIVWKADSAGGVGSASIAVDGLTNPNRQAILYEFVSGLGDSVGIFAGNALAANYYAYPFTNAISMTVIFNDLNNGPGAPDSRYWINGVSANTNAPSGDLNMDGVTLGGRFATAGGDRFTLDGYIAELLIYTNTLSTAERLEVEDYLFNKWLSVPEPSIVMLAGVGALLLRRRMRK